MAELRTRLPYYGTCQSCFEIPYPLHIETTNIMNKCNLTKLKISRQNKTKKSTNLIQDDTVGSDAPESVSPHLL